VIETLTVAVRFSNERQLTTAFTDKKSRKPRQVVRRDIMRMRKEALQRVLRSAAASPNAKTAFGRRIGDREDLDQLIADAHQLQLDEGPIYLDELARTVQQRLSSITQNFGTLGDLWLAMARVLEAEELRKPGRAREDLGALAEGILEIWDHYGLEATLYRAATAEPIKDEYQELERRGFEAVLELAGLIVQLTGPAGKPSKEGTGGSVARAAVARRKV
jgi:hypothetical protein